MYHLPSQTRPGDIFLLIRYNYIYETLKRDNNSKGEPWIIHKQTQKKQNIFSENVLIIQVTLPEWT